MNDGNGRNGGTLKFFWGDKGISVTGPVVIVFLMWLTMVLAVLYSGYRQEQAISVSSQSIKSEHRDMTRSQDRTSCGLMLTLEERSRFRAEYRPGAWQAWCGWMVNE